MQISWCRKCVIFFCSSSVSIDGGGMRGIVALEMLKTIEQTTGKSYKNVTRRKSKS